jgi:hypothetical protein
LLLLLLLLLLLCVCLCLLQVQGLGTALRILYAPDRAAVVASLQRSHVVALFNLLGRLSHSVEVARVAVPLLGTSAHSTCSPRGCAASEYEVEDEADEQPAPPSSSDPFGAHQMSSAW